MLVARAQENLCGLACPLGRCQQLRLFPSATKRPHIALSLPISIALVVADVASKFPTAEDVTADWVYVRLHGSRQLYASGYTPREIEAWTAKVRAWHKGTEPDNARRICGKAKPAPKGRDVFVFFDNTDIKLRAPVDARRMAKLLGIGPRETAGQVVTELGIKRNASKQRRVSGQRRVVPQARVKP